MRSVHRDRTDFTADPIPRKEYHMQNVVLTKLRSDFTAAISSDQNDMTLDPSIADLIDKISGTDFLEPFSIYSRGHLRKMGDLLSDITNVHLKESPLRVAGAVDDILKLFDKLEITVKQTAASEKRIEAGRSS
jgi:hypothetical protein